MSLNEVLTTSASAATWIDGFLAGSEPPPPDSGDPQDEAEWDRCRQEFRDTGVAPRREQGRVLLENEAEDLVVHIDGSSGRQRRQIAIAAAEVAIDSIGWADHRLAAALLDLQHQRYGATEARANVASLLEASGSPGPVDSTEVRERWEAALAATYWAGEPDALAAAYGAAYFAILASEDAAAVRRSLVAAAD
jgi:hypothetical protein